MERYRRPQGGRARGRAGDRRAGESDRGGARGKRGQEHLPGQYEPRDQDADERGHRPFPSRAKDRAHAAPARLRAEDQEFRPAPAWHHQRHSRFLEDRGRQIVDREHRFRSRQGAGECRQPDEREGLGQGARADLRGRAHGLHPFPRRSAQARSDPDQFLQQRRQVHREGRGRRPGSRSGGYRRLPARRVFRERYRHRHDRGADRAPVPGLRAGRRLDHPQIWRHGTRIGDLQAAHRVDGGPGLGPEQTGQGQHVRLHRAAR